MLENLVKINLKDLSVPTLHNQSAKSALTVRNAKCICTELIVHWVAYLSSNSS